VVAAAAVQAAAAEELVVAVMAPVAMELAVMPLLTLVEAEAVQG
jgi:hypothetical protein